MIEINNINIKGISQGDTLFNKIYKGEDLVWNTFKPTGTLSGKFMDDSTPEDWWIHVNGQNESIAEYVNPDTKIFDFDFPFDKNMPTFRNNQKIEHIYNITIPKGCTSMSLLFYACRNLKSITISDESDTSNVISMGQIFDTCEKLETIKGLGNLNVENVQDFNKCFYYCNAIKDFSFIKNWNVKNLTNANQMFSIIHSAENVFDLSDWETSNLQSVHQMFAGNFCKEIKLSDKFYTDKIQDMYQMFDTCMNVKYLDLTSFDTQYVYDMAYMFRGNREMVDLRLGIFDMNRVSNTGHMFESVNKLENVTGTIKNLDISLDLSGAPMLTSESAMVFINGLSDNGTGKQLTFTNGVKSKLTVEQISIATSKGWDVASV